MARNRKSLNEQRLALSLGVLFLGQNCSTSQAFAPIQQQVGRTPSDLHKEGHLYFAPAPSVFQVRPVTACHETRSFFNGDEDEYDSSVINQFVGNNVSDSYLLLMTPAIMALLAFSTYTEVAAAFHTFVDVASGHTWAPVDGGAYLTDLITPALTGPVASFISLLFGTLTSMTVGQLYSRQNLMARQLGEILDDLRMSELHITTLPTHEYRKKGRKLMKAYGALLVEILEHQNLPKAQVVERREAGRCLLEKHMELLHHISGDKAVEDRLNGRALDEAYATLNRLMRTRSSLITTYENSFPIWHYGNLCILAMAILFIFLVLTDKTALLFLGGFQLRMCWSMLIGTLSMLLVVLIDLNTPLSGTFRVVKPVKLAEFELDDYAEFTERQKKSSDNDSLL